MAVKVRKRNGSWWVLIDFRGQRKAKKVGTREAAEKVKREIEARLALGEFNVTPQEPLPTLREYAERWVREYAQVHCKASTVAFYKQFHRLYIFPEFGDLRLNAVRRDHVKRFVASICEKGLAKNTIRLAIASLRPLFNAAIEDGIIQANPATRLGRFVQTEKPERRASALTREETEAFLKASLEHRPRFYPLFLTALRAGLRLGELLALTWSDINFGQDEADSNRFITVRRRYYRGIFSIPKGNRSRRVDMSRELRRVLLEARDARMLAAFQKGKDSITDELVFQSEIGGPVDPAKLVNRHFLPTLETAGLRRIRFHDLRHTFGSLLIQAGAHLAYVRDQMGHSSIKITVDTYGHLMAGADIAWIDKLDEKTKSQQSATQAQPKTGECKVKAAKSKKRWRAWRGSNPRPTDSKSAALSN